MACAPVGVSCAAMVLPALSMAVGQTTHEARVRLSQTCNELDQLDQVLADSDRWRQDMTNTASPEDIPQSPEGAEMDDAVNEAIAQREGALEPRQPKEGEEQVPQEGSTADSSADIALGRTDEVGGLVGKDTEGNAPQS